MENFSQPLQEWIQSIQHVCSLKDLDELRVTLLGKQGEITQAMKSLSTLDPETRKEKGMILNQVRDQITQALDLKRQNLGEEALKAQLIQEKIDVTLPVRPQPVGGYHPVTQALFEIVEIFESMGFQTVEGPHIEDDFYNFDALNIPATHPARQDHDTFYIRSRTEGLQKVLRTHTSPVQIRAMMSQKGPIQIIAPGRTFRSDYDQTHTPNFYQVEGLMIGENIHMGHLKHCITEFCQRMFNHPGLPLRFRPGYFPFTEPSAEVDILCHRKDGQLILGEGDDWLEILGCGMVHPKVLENCELDPARYQGFAFGMGIERVAMLKYGISDLRAFYEGDVRWLDHHSFSFVEGLQKGFSI